MKLPKQDANHFFGLIWPLHLFVNKRLAILPEVDSFKDYAACSQADKLQIRDALYDNIDLIDAFVRENPFKLAPANLGIVAKWKHFVRGDFCIERFLKKFAVFISMDGKVYAVQALHDPFRAMLHPGQLPLLVKTVLLPFKNWIVYDGMLQGYRVSFGRGYRSDFKETYMAAKVNGRIIQSLDPDALASTKPTPRPKAKDWGPEIESMRKAAKSFRASAAHSPILSPAFSLVKASLEVAQNASSELPDLDAARKSLQKMDRLLNNLETALHRAERRG